MGELLRPPPPRSARERLAARWAAVTPARVASGAGAVLLVAVTAWWLLRPGRLPVEATLPRASTTAATRTAAGPPAAGAATPATGAATGPAAPAPTTTVAELIVVQAAGAVLRPGVYRLAVGARVADLVDAAGGPAPDAAVEEVSLAARLADGQRVVVPRLGDPTTVPAAPAGTAPAAAGTTTGQLDLNAATAADLDRLPGVGPATATAIVRYREQHGPFTNVEQLGEVPGIGPAKLEALRPLVTVGP